MFIISTLFLISFIVSVLYLISGKITISKIAKVLNVSTRTIYRNITHEIKKEKILLNEEIQHRELHKV